MLQQYWVKNKERQQQKEMASRQIQPSGNPYASGAVVFDSNPYTEYYLRQENETKAKQEALDKYFADLGNSISPTGMDLENDLPALELMKAQWQKHYQQTKDDIRTKKDGGKAYLDNMKMFGEMRNFIEQSKQKTARLLELDKYRLAHPDAILDPEAQAEINKTRQPIKRVINDGVGNKYLMDNHDWSMLDMGKIKPVTPKTPEQLRAIRKGYMEGAPIREETSGLMPDPVDNFYDIGTKRKYYDRKELATAGLQAASDIEMDNSLRASVSRMKPSPEEFAQLTEAYKYAFGPDARIQDTADLWAAYTVMDNMGESVEPIRQKNAFREAEYRTARQREAAALAFRRAREIAMIRKTKGETTEEEDEDYITSATDAAFESDDELKRIIELGKNTDDSIVDVEVTTDEIQTPFSQTPSKFKTVKIKKNVERKGELFEETTEYVLPIGKGREQVKSEIGRIARDIKVLSPATQRKNVTKGLNNPAPAATPASGSSWKNRAKKIN